MALSSFRPWRSVWLARAVTAAALLAGLPLFLRMPLWCDLTLYDLAARNLLEGGLHYRDVFDTNLPGFVWLLTGIRWLFGFSPFALRCVDLAVVLGIVLLIDRVAKRGGATPASRWWAFAGVAMLYPFAVEMAHCQRDTWMALPVMAAVLIRVRRAAEPTARPFALSALEGLLWGAAVWIKPHVVLMAAGVWLVTARRVADGSPRPWRAFALDLLGNIAGGLAIGGAGVAYLAASGTWPHFWEIISVWAPEYAGLADLEWDDRLYKQELHWFPPWSLFALLAVPLALLSILDALPFSSRRAADDPRPGPVGWLLPGWLWDRTAGPNARFARAALSTLYLVWAYQAVYIQRGFMYVHMTETLLMLGLFAAHRLAVPFVVFVWLALTTSAWVVSDAVPEFRETLLNVAEHDGLPGGDPDREHYLIRHPVGDYTRMRHWADCWRTDLNDRELHRLWDDVKRIKDHEASPGWEELDEVADFLRSQGVKDGELIAWHDSPHALYLTMHLKPGLRFMHINTAKIISPRAANQVMTELWERAYRQPVPRFAVSDLGWAALGQKPEVRWMMLAPPAGLQRVPLLRVGAIPLEAYRHDLYPPMFRNWMRAAFPFNQKPVFRSRGGAGRYIVHAITPEFGDLPVPGDPEGWPGRIED
jgi:hypothetical protein